jgi:hypothetical protein
LEERILPTLNALAQAGAFYLLAGRYKWLFAPKSGKFIKIDNCKSIHYLFGGLFFVRLFRFRRLLYVPNPAPTYPNPNTTL